MPEQWGAPGAVWLVSPRSGGMVEVLESPWIEGRSADWLAFDDPIAKPTGQHDRHVLSYWVSRTIGHVKGFRGSLPDAPETARPGRASPSK